MQLDTGGVIISCSKCGRANRLRYDALHKTTRCGQCRSALMAPGVPIEAGDTASFDAAIEHSALPVVVDFWAPWCGPCRMVAPELERVARASAGRYLVVKVNTDALPDLGQRYRVMSIPTMTVMHEGREIARTSGARPAADITAFVEHALAGRQRQAS